MSQSLPMSTEPTAETLRIVNSTLSMVMTLLNVTSYQCNGIEREAARAEILSVLHAAAQQAEKDALEKACRVLCSRCYWNANGLQEPKGLGHACSAIRRAFATAGEGRTE